MGKFHFIWGVLFMALIFFFTASYSGESEMKDDNGYNKLSPEEAKVIVHRGTEEPFSGQFNNFFQKGFYTCKRCDAKLYRSDDKFASSCGWPSFDAEVEGAVRRVPDADGRRTEIICNNCGAHLGHVFEGERLTEKNIRHCVNSISLNFVPRKAFSRKAKAYFAGGCFWGVEHLFQQKPGVISATSGYMGGTTENPSYEQVTHDNTGHLEAVEVVYDPAKTDFEALARYFFEIHDPTQANGQGPDIGEQYLSAVFYGSPGEKETADKLINILKKKGYDVMTKVLPYEKFWKAEAYHQDYYARNGKAPYCHVYQKRF